jgi:hypothetical protein
MKRIRHSIKRKNIPQTKLVSLTSRNWYDSNGELMSWTGNSGNAYIGPSTGDTIYNVTGGTVTSGYYRWGTPTPNTWNLISGTESYIKTQIYNDNQIPLFLEAKVDEYGPMVGFDKNIVKLFGIPRNKDEPITSYHYNLASSVQNQYEEVLFHILRMRPASAVVFQLRDILNGVDFEMLKSLKRAVAEVEEAPAAEVEAEETVAEAEEAPAAEENNEEAQA